MKISINGKFQDNIVLKGNEPEFNQAYGVFETIRSYKDKPFHLSDHLNRLRASADYIKLNIKPKDKVITEWISKHCELKNDLRIKIIAALDKIYILSEPLNINPKIYTKGVSVGLHSLERNMPSVKSLAYLQEYLAHETAVKQKHHDALLINHKQEVTEGAYSNFFYIKDDVIITPRYKVLSGITKRIVLKLAMPYYRIEQRRVHLDEVLRGNECFLTQTSTGILPIVKIDKRKIKSGKPGPITKHLIELFKEYTDNY